MGGRSSEKNSFCLGGGHVEKKLHASGGGGGSYSL